MRIVSLLRSATDIICALGLGDRLVGLTHAWDWPPFVRGLAKVTRTLVPARAPSAEIDRLVRERLEMDRALYTLEVGKVCCGYGVERARADGLGILAHSLHRHAHPLPAGLPNAACVTPSPSVSA